MLIRERPEQLQTGSGRDHECHRLKTGVMELSSATEGLGEDQNEEEYVGGWIMGP